MENLGITFQFSDSAACQEFCFQLEQQDLSHQVFDLALPERKLNVDNNMLTLLLACAKEGLPALTAFLTLVVGILKMIGSEKHVIVKHGQRSVELKGGFSAKEIKEIAKDLISKE